ncbi:MAG TPA: hypothetical protein VKU60_16320, partial [Chloroflexota bacterium]|nr:hypothetical protein [Chloroflexota bacterium]
KAEAKPAVRRTTARAAAPAEGGEKPKRAAAKAPAKPKAAEGEAKPRRTRTAAAKTEKENA